MDPNAALDKIRLDIEDLETMNLYDDARVSVAEEISESIRALDEWLTQGGFLPTAWQREQGKVTHEWRCPKVKQHMQGIALTPCRECYSVEIVETRVALDLNTITPWQQSTVFAPRWDPAMLTQQDPSKTITHVLAHNQDQFRQWQREAPGRALARYVVRPDNLRGVKGEHIGVLPEWWLDRSFTEVSQFNDMLRERNVRILL